MTEIDIASMQKMISKYCPNIVEQGLLQAYELGWSNQSLDSYCTRCGKTVDPTVTSKHGCPGCINQNVAWDHLVRLDQYTQPIRDWILAMKFSRSWPWAAWFGNALADRIDNCGSQPSKTVVCPVPMHWLRRMNRGYNQAQLIAKAFAKRRSWDCESLLRRTRYVPPQTTLTQTQRLKNVRDSIGERGIDLSGWHVWIVDDVKTTGATLTRCTRLLRKAGAETVNVAVAAVTGPDDGQPRPNRANG